MSTDNSTIATRRTKDITGKQYGKLTVISYAGSNLGSQAGTYWNCKCECGTEKILSRSSLGSGNVQSCGCSKARTDETGSVYNKLTVLEFVGKTKSGDSLWKCQCECGNITIVARGELRKESTKSCGCHRASAGSGYKTPEHSSWREIKARCYNPNNTGYHWYGLRGIRMCAHWRQSFTHFFADMGKKPSKTHSVERINNEGNYSCGHCEECVANGWPANCKWATTLEQGQNTRKTRKLTYNGETYGLREWARRLGVVHHTIARRLEQGWSMEQIVSHYKQSLGSDPCAS